MSSYLNTQQNAIIVALTAFSSTLSITGSFLILRFIKQDTYRDAVKAQRCMGGRGTGSAYTPTYLRIMAGMSFFDVLYSINWILQPIISDSADYDNLLVGNQATCNFTGFMNQLGFAGFIYYGFLSFYYLFTVRWGRSQRWMSQRAEPWMHVIAIGFPTVTAITGLIIDCYSYVDLMLACWVANWPKGCIPFSRLEDENCSSIPGYIFGGIPFFLLIPALIVNNFLVFLHVRRVYRSTASSHFSISRHSGRVVSSIDQRQKKRIQEVGTRTTLYVVVALLTYMPLVINELVLVVILEWGADHQPRLFPWMCVTAVLTSLAGFWNAIIFFRPTYNRLRKIDTGRWEAIKMIFRNDKSALVKSAAAAAVRRKRRISYINSRLSASCRFKSVSLASKSISLMVSSKSNSSSASKSNPSAESAGGSIISQAAAASGKEVSDQSEQKQPSLDQEEYDDSDFESDDYSEVAAETIPALALANGVATEFSTGDNEEGDMGAGEEEDVSEKKKVLTPGAFDTNPVKFPGESQYTVPSTHHT